MSFTGPSLRDRLRTGTRTSQDALERAQRKFDLSDRAGLAAFLAAQRDTLTSLRLAAPELSDVLVTACAMISADLTDLGHGTRAKLHPRPKTDNMQGRGYFWHSQQLALRLISKRLPEEDGPARRFLTAPRDVAAWRALCDEIENVPGYGPDGDAALTTANNWLALCETVHLEHLRTRS